MQLLEYFARPVVDRPLVRCAVRRALSSCSPVGSSPTLVPSAGPRRLPHQHGTHRRVVPHRVVPRHRALWRREQAGRLRVVLRGRSALDGTRRGHHPGTLRVESLPCRGAATMDARPDLGLDAPPAGCVRRSRRMPSSSGPVTDSPRLSVAPREHSQGWEHTSPPVNWSSRTGWRSTACSTPSSGPGSSRWSPPTWSSRELSVRHVALSRPRERKADGTVVPSLPPQQSAQRVRHDQHAARPNRAQHCRQQRPSASSLKRLPQASDLAYPPAPSSRRQRRPPLRAQSCSSPPSQRAGTSRPVSHSRASTRSRSCPRVS